MVPQVRRARNRRPVTRRTLGAALVPIAVAGTLVAGAERARADATTTLADWQMNEPSGATVMADSSGNGIDGQVGSAVLTGNVEGDVTFYKWTHTNPNQPPPKPERLIQVADDRLNPGTGDYAVTIRFRTTRSFGNIIQKGQAETPGGNFKWQIPNGKLQCQFRGFDESGNELKGGVSSGPTPLNDGLWHTVRCERTADMVTMTVDGQVTGRNPGPTGSISNTVPLTIGGKLNCDQVTITCDYFVGDIDFVLIETGGGAEPPPPPPPPSGSTVFADDFSDGFANWTSVTRMTLDETTGSPSAPSARVQVSGQSAFATKVLPDAYTSVCMSLDVNETQLGSNALMRLRTAGNGPIVRVLLDSGGFVRVRSDFSGATSPRVVALGSGWHTVRLCGTVGSAGAWDLYYDGAKVLDQWVADTGSSPVGRINIGDTSAKTWTANFDRVVVEDLSA